MNPAASQQKSRRQYEKHGDIRRKRQLWREGVSAIDGRTRAGKIAKTWLRRGLEKKGGRRCPIDLREKIEAGAFYLWRALCLRSYIVADARKRGTPMNKRRMKLPEINHQHDILMERWQRINDELDLDKQSLDDLRREMLSKAAGNGGQGG